MTPTNIPTIPKIAVAMAKSLRFTSFTATCFLGKVTRGILLIGKGKKKGLFKLS